MYAIQEELLTFFLFYLKLVKIHVQCHLMSVYHLREQPILEPQYKSKDNPQGSD